ncbi:MAG: TonB-dependent receptor [Bacteroidales bacterium]|nr:TonB-dependent receptor [Bacteroidales bacterium]
MKKLISLIAVLALALPALAQQSVSGTVTEAATGEPVIGASVMVHGTTVGAITDLDGTYTLNVPANAVLVFDCIGFRTVTLNVNGRSTIDVALEEDAEFLDEVVVVGYSVQKRRDVLGAVSKVDGKDLRKVPVASVQESLQGRVAGVNVTSQTGAPGAGISVRVRGTGSISSSNEPLYIVDGIPVEGALNTLAAGDIEEISILKDASSAAIYGSRATNGVVLITTKSGKEGSAKVTYNMQAGVQFHGALPKMTNTEQYIQLYNEATNADNANSEIQRKLIEGEYVKNFANVNHLEQIFRVAPIHQHELSVSGGTAKNQYLVSASYFGQDGIIHHSDYNRAGIRASINSEVKDWLKIGFNVNGSISNNRLLASSGDGYNNDEGGSVVRYALFRNPAIPVYDDNGNYVDSPSEYFGDALYNSFFGNGYSPEGLAEYTDRTNKTKTLLVTGNVQVNFTKNLFWKTTMGLDYRNNSFRLFNRTWGTEDRINATNGLTNRINENLNWTVNSTLNHSLEFGGHRINYLVGAEAIKNHEWVMAASNERFSDNNPDLLYIGIGEGALNANNGESGSALLSFFASANYNYDGRYYVSGILREDGSSRFSRGNRWGTFYSVSAGWNADKEEFLKDVSWLNKLKVRVGYGAIGNQNIGLYAYSDRYSGKYYYSIGGTAVDGYAQTSLGNSDLKWETSRQLNAGVDVEVLDGTLGGSVDYYYKITDNMLVQESLPTSVGYTATPWINNGSVLNTGVDLELFYRRQFSDWGFNITWNGGYLHNEVLSLVSPMLGGLVNDGVYATRTEVGQPIGSFYMYKMEGIFQNEMEILTSPYQGASTKPGDVRYADVFEDGVIDDKDRTFVGSAIPKFTTGLNLSANWKNFDLSIFFQGAFGQKVYVQYLNDSEGFYRGFPTTLRYFNEHWTGEGTSNTQPRAAWAASHNRKVSTRFLEDGSYLRLKNVQLGYTIKLPESWKIFNCRVYVAGTNLLTFTGYTGLDPEMTVNANSTSEGDRANGIDWGNYPVAKSVTFGLNLTF